jgi:alpha-2-macroglobulin
MIKIPIPGGCSYGSKSDGYRWNEYREYFKNETIIYSQKLKKGVYTYDINLIPRFNGLFTLNPAKVELMYFPVFNANNELKTVRVK